LIARPVADTGVCAPPDMTTVITAFWLGGTTGFGRTTLPIGIIDVGSDSIVFPRTTDKKTGIHSISNVINEIASSP